MLNFRLILSLLSILGILGGTCSALAESEKIDIIKAYHRGNYQQVIELGKQTVPDLTLWRYIAAAHAQVGKTGDAIKIYQELLTKVSDAEEQSSLLADLSQLLVTSGKLKDAQLTAEKALKLSQSSRKKAILKGVLGNIYSRLAKYEEAIALYQESLKKLEGNGALTALNNLATTYGQWGLQLEEDAAWAKRWLEVETYEQLSQKSHQANLKKQEILRDSVKLSQEVRGVEAIRALLTAKQSGIAIESNEEQLLSQIELLPDSRTKGEFFLLLNQPESARQVARKIGDLRLLSFALGEAGKNYQSQGNLPQALTLLMEAQQAAWQSGAWDSLYLWQWQAGRIYRQTGHQEKAISAYLDAIDTLNRIRQDLAQIRQQLQFSQKIEPLYRETLELLLLGEVSSSKLIQVREVLKQYQLALVENYFNSPCPLSIQSVVSEEGKALVYLISLSDSTHLLVQLPDSTLTHFKIDLTSSDLEQLAVRWRGELSNLISDDYRTTAQVLYDKLISPMSGTLKKHQINTLVLIPSGALPSLPLAALFDGKQFLVEKYNLAFSVGIRQNSPEFLKKIGGVTFGLSIETEELPPLPGVRSEVNQIVSLTNSQKFLNAEFTYQSLANALNQKQSFVHLATHGRFGGNASATWLQAFDGQISLFQMESLLLSTPVPLNMLVLSGCETAVGNNRSILGMGGLALRAGVNTVVSSLWQVGDLDSVDLMTAFYEYYQQGFSPVEALRKAQLKMLGRTTQHPSSWAGFIVISN